MHRPPPGSSEASGWPVCGPRRTSRAVGRAPGSSPPLPGHHGAGEGGGAGTTGGGRVQRETSHTRWKAESEHHVPATWRPPRPAGQAAHHSVPAREGVEEASVWTDLPAATCAWPCTALYSLQMGRHPVSPWLLTSSPVCLDAHQTERKLRPGKGGDPWATMLSRPDVQASCPRPPPRPGEESGSWAPAALTVPTTAPASSAEAAHGTPALEKGDELHGLLTEGSYRFVKSFCISLLREILSSHRVRPEPWARGSLLDAVNFHPGLSAAPCGSWSGGRLTA